MDDIEKELSELSELSERTTDLRMLAAKMEPVAERLENRAALSRYDLGSAEAKAAAWSAPAQALAAGVDELRGLADRIDQAVGAARSLTRGGVQRAETNS
jgi:hypothetical protein